MKRNVCTSVQELLALRPADWDEDERRQAEEHLAICAACAGRARAYAAQDQVLQSLPTAGLDDSARRQLFARLERERKDGAVRPRMAWVLGAVALAVVVLAISLLLWQSSGIGDTGKHTPTTGPTQVLMPSPTITPTTALTATPVGERSMSVSRPVGETTPYTPLACRWDVPAAVALDRAPPWPHDTAKP